MDRTCDTCEHYIPVPDEWQSRHGERFCSNKESNYYLCTMKPTDRYHGRDECRDWKERDND